MTTSYQTGWRKNRILVTTSLTISGGGTHGNIKNLVNGNSSADSNNAVFPDPIPDNTGKFIRFDFRTPTIFDEFTYRDSGSWARGNYQGYGWDGVNLVPIGPVFALGGAPVQIITAFSGNTTPYLACILLGVGGAVSGSGWMLEFEFKEFTPPVQFKNPTVTILDPYYPIEIVPQIPDVAYGAPGNPAPPPYILIARSQTMYGCLPGDMFKAWANVEGTWDFGTLQTMVEWPLILMLRKDGNFGPILFLDDADLDGGAQSNWEAMKDNSGKNITRDEHHAVQEPCGRGYVREPGDYYVGIYSMCSMGPASPGGSYVSLSDSNLMVEHWRSGV